MPNIKKPAFDPTDLPTNVIVYLEQDGDDSYLCAARGLDGIEHDHVVGMYELRRLGRVAIGVTLEDI